jgi:hypothetical protein
MQTMTAPQIADLHARRAMAGLGRVPPLGQCLTAALAKRLYDDRLIGRAVHGLVSS